MSESRHVALGIAAPADAVYTFAADPRHLPEWAAGLASGSVEQARGRWTVVSPMGVVGVEFAATNPFGVLDHVVTLPSGERVLNPMRVIPDGDGCEVVFTLRRRPGMSGAEFDADTRAVAEDLGRLRRAVELL